MAYDFRDFLNKVMDMRPLEIISFGTQEGTKADKLSQGRGGKLAREAGSLDYAKKIESFLFFLQNVRRPSGIDDEEFQKYKIIVEALVEKG